MLDIQFIREHSDEVKEKAKQKGYDVDVERIVDYDRKRREALGKLEDLQRQRNELAEQAKGQRPSDELVEQGRQLKGQISEAEEALKKVGQELDEKLKDVPNIFPDDTPLGGEDANREEKLWGQTPEKPAIDHLTWGERRGFIDFERGTKVAGNKFYYLKGPLVDLEMALLQLSFKIVKEQGFIPMEVPHLVNDRMIYGTGFAARGEEKQVYKVEDNDLNLIATAEIPLTGYYADEILQESDLPKLFAGYSPAYRMEAGAYGKHSRGLYRVHQFNKLEMYVFCKPEDSEQWHQKLVLLEENICQQLGIPYRLVRIAAGDLGAPAYKKFDIEYWSPADKVYHELMSCSNVTDYQARRLNIRYKDQNGTHFVHTLNGTAAAMSRMLIAIIENFQNDQGKVVIPEVLQPYMAGQTEI